ncbi:RHTO0S06e12024g1_1 [Rhodotorula toruloides]|uniref:RHTO0S06e12024g1_1 n=2 Tax=Rhodotorula toruloides TaxID=5286 RepID=A0A061AXI3_RHOTO|nr:uncharacterized protein RHTO_06651 [Rhodotorula toruloides NP11]EMS18157.1 hypothetical protein RHTO_06651 [Rhodotorula toruloides NP11]KAJ8293628.1 hypothetical protein OF846_003622 [Rhodotorula toruloides]CDR42269.1 RHTO0S06e12024g1_1 [Rhodotorula toruloides]
MTEGVKGVYKGEPSTSPAQLHPRIPLWVQTTSYQRRETTLSRPPLVDLAAGSNRPPTTPRTHLTRFGSQTPPLQTSPPPTRKSSSLVRLSTLAARGPPRPLLITSLDLTHLERSSSHRGITR